MHKAILVYLLTVSTACFANTIDVCSTCAHTSLEAGYEASSSCDTIVVHPGLYKMDNLVIDHAIVLLGLPGAILESKHGDELITVNADHVTIKGLTIQHVTTSYLKERSGIRIVKRRYFEVTGNRIIHCFFGIYLENAKNGIVSNNQIIGNATTEAASGNGIHAWHSEKIEITGNRIEKHRDGIYFEFVDNSVILDNVSVSNMRYGLHFMFSNDDQYRGNVFRNNGVGVAVMFSRRITMENNHFAFNWGRASYGLLLKEIFDGEISDNDFEQNTIGIFVEGSNRIRYRHNDFTRNGWAIKFSGGCEDNEVVENNFIHNSLDLVVNARLASNAFHHNYWSGYVGYDLNKDGIGDAPYYPVKLFSHVLDVVPEAIVLMRSLFVDLVNLSEKISPVFTPKDVRDDFPLLEAISHD